MTAFDRARRLAHRRARDGLAVCIALLTTMAASAPHAAAPVPNLRVYALDCGRIDFKDMSAFSDTFEYDGQSGSIVVPCFLVRHPHGTLLWDLGLGDQLKGRPRTGSTQGVNMHVETTLSEQLGALGVAPADITYLAFSHLHGDHTGNANAFASATWILNRVELAWAEGKPTPFAVDPETFDAYRRVHTRMIDSDYDVFGDGSVRILKAPGHTPGHQVLLLRLAHSGPLILAGDLYHVRADRAHRRVPSFNVDRAATLASYDRVERIVENTHARLVIEHDPEDFRALPKFPAFLD